MQNQRAVNFTSNRGAFHPSHATFPDYLQSQLASWRSSSFHPYHQRHYTQPYTMNTNTQQDSGDNGTWVRAHSGREENEPLTSAWANIHLSHPQPEQSYGHQSFFADNMDYHPEEAALFIPLSGPVPRSMEALTPSYAPPATRESDASTATRLLQTNVDAAQYGPVFQEDWRRASIDFDDEDAPSPALTEATSHGPFTPNGYDGDFGGLGLAAMRQLSHELSSSYDSLSSDPLEGMFKDVTVSSIRAFDPWEISKACRTTTTQASIGIQYAPLSSNSLAGLPMLAARSMHRTVASDEKPSLSQGSFRDVDGLPTEASTPSSEHTRLRATTQLLSIAPAVTESSNSRKSRNQYLLDMREKGFTYREIKDSGDFDEAESTLRGRVRVLTKARSERVRKPEWTDRDVCLLRRGVTYVSRQPAVNGNRRRRTGKLPWKDISAYIRQHGGSYSFAPATCAKKWEEVAGDD
jgi:hypothetical protein